MGSNDPILAIDCDVDKILSVAKQLGLLEHFHLMTSANQFLLLTSSKDHVLLLLVLSLLVVQLIRLIWQGNMRMMLRRLRL